MIRQLHRKALGLIAAAALSAMTVVPASATENFRLSTLGPGTSPYVVMNTFANIVNEKLPEYSIEVNATGAATRHAIETAMGRSQFFMSSPNLYHLMETESGPFAKSKGAAKQAEKLRALFNFPLGYYHIATFADSGIETFEDFRGKRLFLGPPGGAANEAMRILIEAVTGYKAKEDYDVVSLGWDAAAQGFQDGHIDVYFNPTLPPSPIMTQVAMTNKIRLLGIPNEKLQRPEVQKLLERPGFFLGSIPAGIYGDNQVTKGDVLTIGATVGIITNQSVPEETIYKITKIFWENIDGRARQTELLKNVQFQRAFDQLNIVLHPGAARYYREKGLEIPENLTGL
ncbi:C4-dicarboxylate ABC transporter substrate-binding protein [Marinobacterium nitratireducens]|uniref:C4-dicarboxylate ABC transporter substrate-binding protein n=1 Tax=Marinobacterium nitratireducens TaxID=518897 RepID=A0A918DRB6_9GAMM|nr:TAXI family TRAP transporter solute-binding subunit [Marinobacterium nitratireducens]GGO79873.1 C4-dicarboxylate ABC transporter substrate-binding protein [Marinobacterium nitratireducens]